MSDALFSAVAVLRSNENFLFQKKIWQDGDRMRSENFFHYTGFKSFRISDMSRQHPSSRPPSLDQNFYDLFGMSGLKICLPTRGHPKKFWIDMFHVKTFFMTLVNFFLDQQKIKNCHFLAY